MARLHYPLAPMTVANFLGLAEGAMAWQDPFTRERKKSHFYDGLSFHKVVPGLLIHGGDPKGNGHGGPGYLLDREIDPSLRHDRPGILSMLNEDGYAHGSQFLITLGPAPFLDGRHAVFGEVVDGLTVLDKLERGDRITRVTIQRRGAEAHAFDIAPWLERIRQRATEIETEKKAERVKSRSEGGREGRRRELPELAGKIDPSRVPRKNQPAVEKVALEYILITHRGAMTPREYQVYEREDALRVAEHLTRAARMEANDFVKLVRQYSDSPDYKIPLLKRDGNHPKVLEPVFHLEVGQVSDPIHTTKGYMIFSRVRLDLITVRHILIAYQGAQGSRQDRSKEDAMVLAKTILQRAQAGEEFAKLAETYSDSPSGKRGGLIGEIARGMTVPAFDAAAFKLAVNQISGVTPTPSGFQIIQRLE